MRFRLLSLDVIRGIGLVGVVFLHTALYQYGGLFSLDMDNPPVTVTIIGFLLMWAGLFALVSTCAYAIQLYRRMQEHQPIGRLVRDLIVKGLLVLVLSVVYFMVFGPALVNFDADQYTHSLLGGLLHEGRWTPFSFERLVYVDALVMLAWNVIFFGFFTWLLKPKFERIQHFSVWLMIIGTVVVFAGAVRIPLFSWYESYIDSSNPFLGWAVSQLVNKNNPILPFLGFGLIGASIGFSVAQDWQRIRRRTVGLIGLAWLIVGGVTMFLLPDTMLERTIDWTWYAITFVLLGLFILLLVGLQRLFDAPARQALFHRRLYPLLRFGRVPLTVFFLETPVRELYMHVWNAIWPGWSDTIPVTLMFAASLVGLWAIFLWLWEKASYIGTVEWLLAQVYRWCRVLSDKPSAITTQEVTRPFSE